MADMHEATFCWPEVDASTVIVTGTFDQWASSVHLTKTPRGFEGKVKLPWGERVLYKFIVDGRWVTAQSQPQEPDASGNVNNVYECPSEPISSAAEPAPPLKLTESTHDESEAPPAVSAVLAPLMDQNTVAEKTSQAAQQTKDTVADVTNVVPPESLASAPKQADMAVAVPILGDVPKIIGTSEDANETAPPAHADLTQNESEGAQVTAEETKPAVAEPPIESDQDFAPDHEQRTEDSVGAVPEAQTKGSGALAFVTSNLGTAIHALTGVDPLNQDKIPIATPTPTHDTFEVGPQEQGDVDSEPKPAVSSDAEAVPVENVVSSTTSIPVPAETIPVEVESVSPVEPSPHVEPSVHVEAAAAEANVASSSTLEIPHHDASSESMVEVHTPLNNTTEPAQEEASDVSTHNIEPVVMSEVSAVTESVPVTPTVDDATIPPPPTIDAPLPGATDGMGLVAVAVDVPASEPTMATTEPETSDPTGTTNVGPAIFKSVPRPEIAEAETKIAENDMVSTIGVPKEVMVAIDNTKVEMPIAPSTAEVSPPTEVATLAINNKAAVTLPISAATAHVTSDKPDMVSSGAVASTINTNDVKKTDASSPEKPSNGHSTAAASTTATSDAAGPHGFPATSPAADSPATSKHGRKKRTSFFGKVKHLFSSDKEGKK